jgi:PAS domain S-box-containing protein
MNKLNAIATDLQQSKLSVSYKAPINLNEFLQQLPDVVIVTSPEFIIKSFNHAAESFFGQPASHFIGTVLESSVKFEFRHESREKVFSALFTTGVWNGEIVVRRFNNQDFIFNSNVSLLYDEHGKVNSIVLVNHNITEEEKQQKRLAVAEDQYEILVESLSEGVIWVNREGLVITANKKAAEILHCTREQILGAEVASASWQAIREDGTPFPLDLFPAMISLRQGIETNDVVMGIPVEQGKINWISINTRPIFKEGSLLPDAVVTSFKDITKEKQSAERLKESELLFRSFMTNSPMLAWIYDEHGNFVYGNPLFIERIGLDGTAIGKNIRELSPLVAHSILSRNQQVLLSGQSLITEDELQLPDGSVQYFLANWFPLPGTNKKLVGGHAVDITDRKKDAQKIATMHERFTYVVNASSDAIWDLDLRTGEVYRSDAFLKISGYSKQEIESNLDWWFEKIHPEDKDRVLNKVESQLVNRITNWEDEYRFLHADGHYVHIHDKGFSIYENDIPVRQVGSMTDITERKRLESQLMQEHVQKQKLVNQTTINAQEEERNRISGELHDNVNQLLISARLHIGVAKTKKENQDELLDKATEYLLAAVEEIRALSKRMNSKVVTTIGLMESISDIIYNMEKLNQIEVHDEISPAIIQKLTEEQQLMVFRIVQEQTSNIIKHSGANKANIILVEKDKQAHLVISDNGKGFDKEKQVLRSMGFINIFNRVDAYNGQVEIVTSPGNGCALLISFPLSKT